MWSWGNAYLFDRTGVEYLDKHNVYKFESENNSWYIIDAETLRFMDPYNK